MLSLAVLVWGFVWTLALGAAHWERAPHYDLEDAEQLFQEFIQTYNKQYDTEHERQYRFGIFKQNLEKINRLNQGDGAVFGITKFSDMAPKEFSDPRLCLVLPETDSDCNLLPAVKTSAPKSFDWRSKEAVTPVKNQGGCGSCWAFSTTGNIEGQYAIKHNKLIALSEQQLVDCDKLDRGCGGGFMYTAFRSLIEIGGIMSENDYPYKGEDEDCTFNKGKVAAKLTDCNSYQGNEEQLLSTLYAVGPLSVAIDASGLQHYKKNVMTVDDCPPNQLDHGVLLVGYGDDNGVPYWLLKNSWGSDWGESGYFRIERGVNACNMTYLPPSSSVVA